MLKLKNIVKNYVTGEETVRALKGVSLNFRTNEFVSILGPSGCGKTTMLNIIGGLDRYTDGDLVINGKSTKEYRDRDWDVYRNHRIGFVFQSYNLIPHQTVLENVELALTLSGENKTERRKKATAILEKVGLGDKINNKPNQLSGGQMQRVAIARALVNNPDILLADEPTGALDTKTSEQIMDLLKEVAKDKLVIMVTHNPALAEKYSTRIVKLLDGSVVSDSMPYDDEDEKPYEAKKEKTSMSFWTAMSLSMKNLMTKKARTILVSFAGSIGIIGIALILSLSSGFQAYIDRVQEDALSNYPVTINSETQNYSQMAETVTSNFSDFVIYPDGNEALTNPVLTNMLKSSTLGTIKNDLASFNTYLNGKDELWDHVNDIKYNYDVNINLFKLGEDGKYNQANTLDLTSYYAGAQYMGSVFSSYFNVFSEMINNSDLLKSQYELLAGDWNDMSNATEALLVVSPYNTITDYALYNLGIKTNNIIFEYYRYLLINGYLADMTPYAQYTAAYVATMSEAEINEFLATMGITPESANYTQMRYALSTGYFASLKPFATYTKEYFTDKTDEEVDGILKDKFDLEYSEEEANEKIPFTDLVGLQYKVLSDAETYSQSDGVFAKQNGKSDYVQTVCGQNDTLSLKIVGIVRLKEGASGCLNSGINYSYKLTEKLISNINSSAVVTAQKADTSKDVLTGEAFTADNSADKNLTAFGVVDAAHPDSISIYPKSFDDKDYIVSLIDEYNADKSDREKISYTDTLGIMISSITDILNAITIVLTAFVSTSLVVSSIMIGVITYISVLERIKEIGILRAIGASKRDIANVFNAETIIIGLAAGLLGIGITLLLNWPISLIVHSLTGIVNVAQLPWQGAVILVAISTLLTFISGLIPSGMAAKKDPVEALRSD